MERISLKLSTLGVSGDRNFSTCVKRAFIGAQGGKDQARKFAIEISSPGSN